MSMFIAQGSYSPPRLTNNPDRSGGAKEIRQDLVDATKSREDGELGMRRNFGLLGKDCTLRVS